jgi:S-disulfanyl-L-cysteine oxidoreductase SoxD
MPRRLVLPLIAAAIGFHSARAQGTDSTSRGKSVLQGVYTEEQAARGDSEHQTNCSSCHGTEKYVGDAFAKAWFGRTAFDLFDQLRTTMPDDNPGGLSAQQYTDIVAYIFKANGYPAGAESLPGDPEALRLIRIEAKPDKQTAFGLRLTTARPAGLRPMFHPHAPLPPTAER